MRSVVKLLSFILLAILVPTLVMGLVSYFTKNQIALIIGQFLIMVLMVIAFTKAFDLIRNYEKTTYKMIKQAKDISELRKIRDERISYKSKAMASKAILLKEFSKEEAENLRKYTNSTEDMKHYYSSYISNSSGEKREEFKVKRDNFNKKYKNRTRIYPDLGTNLRMTLKWVGLFFVIAIFFSLIKSTFNPDLSLAFLIYALQIILLLSFMVNGIIWIIRSVTSYWDRKFL
ncbi:MAG: hypothetical protein Q4D88_03095 [Anaerococcus sp.]|nr:hypothetical protein [Anaerococcus sp.]